MNRTELVTEILKLTGHKRSLHPDVNFGIQRLLDKYDKGLKSGHHETIVMCENFYNDGNTTSATKCKFCGKEKWEHPNT